MEVKPTLVALINYCARLMEKHEELGLDETEAAIMDEGTVQLLQSGFGPTMDLTLFSPKMQNAELWKEINSELKMYLNSEFNPTQPVEAPKNGECHKTAWR